MCYIDKNYLNFWSLEDDQKPEDFLKDQQLLESPYHLPTFLVTDENSRKFINALEKFKLPTEIER